MKKREPNQKRGWRWRLLFWIVTILSTLVVIYFMLEISTIKDPASPSQLRALETRTAIRATEHVQTATNSAIVTATETAVAAITSSP